MISKYFFPHVGGVEKHVAGVVRKLQERGISTTLITEKFEKNLLDNEEWKGVKILRFEYPKIKFIGLIFIWTKLILVYFNEFRRADIVHIHDVFIWYLPLRFIFPFKKVFITFHGYPSYPLGRKVIFYQKIAEKLTHGNIYVGTLSKNGWGSAPKLLLMEQLT
jgi:glycosyltransferase involved in cell wall biosynthesis